MKLETNYKEVENVEKGGIELYFDNIPTYAERTELKANGYRWNNAKKCWYIKKNKINSTKTTKVKTTQNEFGVKVGDVFVMTWGYEQTNETFFRVEKLRGKKQVVVKEINPKIAKQTAFSGMSADRTYNTKDFTYCDNSCFIEDNENGDIKTICKSLTRENEPILKFDYNPAKLYKGETLYESWYA